MLRHPLLFVALLLSVATLIATPLFGQAVENPDRLAGVMRVQVRAEAGWDEMITTSAGGATADQFRGALEQELQRVIGEADAAPSVVPGAPATVACHVDTYYETGMVLYALRVQLERQGADGQPIITWLKSWVGSYTAQQMHQMFTLGTQCAESFLEDWRSVN